MASLGAEYGVHCWDMPGHGRSTLQGASDLTRLLDAAASSIRAATSNDRLVVVGHGFGGVVAQLLAERFDHRILGLVLSSSPIIGQHEPVRSSLPGVSWHGPIGKALWGRRYLRLASRASHTLGGQAYVKLCLQRLGSEAYAERMQLWREASMPGPVTPPDMPLLLVHGAEAICPAWNEPAKRLVATNPNVTLRRISGAGALVQMGHPAAFNEALSGFLGRVRALS
ncbi:alpha/beta hydrolase [Pseudoclavibacter alba]|uniref:Alpha/beta hydrolase n=1 Tax=Pseudoclavibacter albus TaxID=272241 RepID=A0ABT2HVW3_9MICO|nr:alpha/beta hydrolase [Pseudoclavibacter alba]